jgi:hypothetical protein
MSIPGERIWDIAVASDGKRYVAADAGTLYLLRDEKDSPAQAVATVPDKNVYALATGEKGDIYLATMPRGKVYRLSAGKLTAAYEGEESIASLAVDKAGNLYVGTSPNCTVYRVAVDGTKTKILTGIGTGNRHVLDLLLVRALTYGLVGIIGGELCGRIKYILAGLESKLNIDDDTQLYNQRYIARMMSTQIGINTRYHAPFAVGLISLTPALTSELKPSRRRALCRDQLRRPAARIGRERAVRVPSWRLHRGLR